jgi:hypothetical protein
LCSVSPAYRLYYETFEKRGSDAGVRGIAFFFGIAFIIEVLIILQFGVDQRSVTAPMSARPGGSAICGFRSGWWSRSWSPPR